MSKALGCGQNAVETHDEEIPEPVDVDVLGSAAHVILLEVTDSLADGGFDLSLGSHGNMMIANQRGVGRGLLHSPFRAL